MIIWILILISSLTITSSFSSIDHEVIKEIQNFHSNIPLLNGSTKFAQDSDLCHKHYSQMTESFHNEREWGLKMFDAWGKIPSGMLYRNIYDFGNYDQCVESDVTLDGIHVIGQYCIVPISHRKLNASLEDLTSIYKLVPSLQIATCTPSTCSPSTVVTLLNSTLNKYNLIITTPNIDDYCRTREQEPFDGIAIFAM